MSFKNFRLRLIFLLTLSSATLLNAANYNDDLLNIYMKMAPRFIVMSSQKAKINVNIEICALYEPLDESVAKSLVDKIHNAYPNGLKNHPIKFILSDYSKPEACKNSQLAFMLEADDKRFEDALLFLRNNGVLAMSYDISFLEKGADVSLFVGRNIAAYINMESITNKKIVFNNLLLRVSKIYTKAKK